MTIKRIRFQAGLSMPEFFKLFGTEALCSAALENARWPDGFGKTPSPRCPDCGGAAHCILRCSGNKVFQCNACRHQTSLIAGTVFQSTGRYFQSKNSVEFNVVHLVFSYLVMLTWCSGPVMAHLADPACAT